METTKFVLNENQFGEIQLFSDDKQAGKMDISIQNELLTIYHTEVYEEYGGRGFARILLDAAVSHARENGLMIAPLCPYAYAQFKRRPEEYQDIWHKRTSQ